MEIELISEAVSVLLMVLSWMKKNLPNMWWNSINSILLRTCDSVYLMSLGMGCNLIWEQFSFSIWWKKYTCSGLHSECSRTCCCTISSASRKPNFPTGLSQIAYRNSHYQDPSWLIKLLFFSCQISFVISIW